MEYPREEDLRINAWINYHNNRGGGGGGFDRVLQAHGDFVRGWNAAREQQVGGDFPSTDFAAGYHAYFDSGLR